MDLACELSLSLELQTLRARNGKIIAANVVVLADALKSNTTLTKLDLSHNRINDAGAAGLAEALKSNTKLTELE